MPAYDVTIAATFKPTVLTGIADVETGHAPSLQVWASEGRLKIAANIAGTAYIYNISGVLVKTAAYLSGETSVALSSGVYIVRTEGKTTKVLIK
jgi:hypothetical protein